jgi:hypothetical protein
MNPTSNQINNPKAAQQAAIGKISYASREKSNFLR